MWMGDDKDFTSNEKKLRKAFGLLLWGSSSGSSRRSVTPLSDFQVEAENRRDIA